MPAYQVEVTITCTAKLYFEAADADAATAMAEAVQPEDMPKKTCHWPISITDVIVDSTTEQANYVG